MMLPWVFLLVLHSVYSYSLPFENPFARNNVADYEKAENLSLYLLPKSVSPSLYKILLEPNLKEPFNFSGNVEILTTADVSINTITLHSNGLTLQETISVLDKDNNNIFDGHNIKERDFLELILNRALVIGEEVTIKIEFTGTLGEANEGFYRGYYGDQKYFATTQFEPTFARKAFPCFDEPSYKAKFQITIKREAEYNTVSNTKLVSTKKAGEKFEDVFETTETMSTYLIAFHVSDYQSVISDDKKHEVYAEPEKIAKNAADYALSISPKVMEEMQKFTGLENYRNGKMSQIGVPDEFFDFGAMENWGAVIYKESVLLYEEGVSAIETKRQVARVVSHEYSHQWFGDLVSPKWWTYIWLNEGFATYFEHYIGHKIEPDFRFDEQYVVVSNQKAMKVDSSINTRPMTFEAASTEEIQQLFDNIAYEKSGAVIRMMEHFLTTANFQSGLQKYLNNKTLSNVDEDDLYTFLEPSDTSLLPEGVKFSDLMKKWTQQKGYPVVTVSRDNNKSLTLKQHKFVTDGDSDDTLFYIPITYMTSADESANTSTKYWLTTEEMTIPVSVEDGNWIIFNAMAVGYYRVNYDSTLWSEIIKFLKGSDFKLIPPVNRAQLIDDAFKLAYANQLDMSTLMNLIDYIQQEDDFIVLYSYLANLEEMEKYLPGTKHYSTFQDVVKKTLQHALEVLGTSEKDGDTPIDKMNRIQVLKWLCKYKDENCLKEMAAQLKVNEKPKPDMQEPVFCGASRYLSKEESFSILVDLYNKATENGEKKRIINGIGCTGDEQLALDLLTKEEQSLKAHDEEIVKALLNNEVGLAVTVTFMVDKKQSALNERPYLLEEVAARVSSDIHQSLIKNFMGELDETYKEEVEKVEKIFEFKKNWLAKQGKSLDDFLYSKYLDNGSYSITPQHIIFIVIAALFVNAF